MTSLFYKYSRAGRLYKHPPTMAEFVAGYKRLGYTHLTHLTGYGKLLATERAMILAEHAEIDAQQARKDILWADMEARIASAAAATRKYARLRELRNEKGIQPHKYNKKSWPKNSPFKIKQRYMVAWNPCCSVAFVEHDPVGELIVKAAMNDFTYKGKPWRYNAIRKMFKHNVHVSDTEVFNAKRLY